MTTLQEVFSSRHVSDFGETLVVHEVNGVKYLVDPCDASVVVKVPVGRRAQLIQYRLCPCQAHVRDAHALVISEPAGLGFSCVKHHNNKILLPILSVGQVVDVLPAAELLFAYAALIRPLPVLYGAIAVTPTFNRNQLVA